MQFWKKVAQYKNWIIFLLLVALAAAGGTFYFKHKNNSAVVKETTVTVEQGDIQSTVSATGTIQAVNSVDIASRVTGLITDVRVKENDHVKAGQVLVVLDDTSVKAQVAQYHAEVENYAAVYERSKKLAAIGGESQQQLDSDRTNYLTAKSQYDNYVTQLDYYVIKSPIDGVVIGKPTPAGETVVQGISSAQTLMSIADMSKMQIKVLVDETDIGKVQIGQAVSFTVDAYTDKTFTGKVTGISKSATTSSNVVYYPVYVDVDSPQGLLYPTMTARVTITVGERKNVLVVPLAAIKDNKGQQYVQVMVNGKPQDTPVTLGLRDDEKVEILNGLSEGSSVVVPDVKPKTSTGNQRQGPPPPI
ncbi:rnd efflux pump membrane fusion protein barrel-sandwich domain [Lucifera butyrica]|uniref:Rnd efflux pump membrane fusion protein barrel-sandwich domain n=1 Tax=Lucifera butyrica TaxID=1351585 RepID=A0A498R2M3_9FIRM|nr:efflux RND transporter periplasmic adaptor subunit [Lucifera butyrica]VBB05010.1 rnd efflux pump membrane fusion protein barrel-sandwich domain [Lucifera butyrica]